MSCTLFKVFYVFPKCNKHMLTNVDKYVIINLHIEIGIPPFDCSAEVGFWLQWQRFITFHMIFLCITATVADIRCTAMRGKHEYCKKTLQENEISEAQIETPNISHRIYPVNAHTRLTFPIRAFHICNFLTTECDWFFRTIASKEQQKMFTIWYKTYQDKKVIMLSPFSIESSVRQVTSVGTAQLNKEILSKNSESKASSMSMVDRDSLCFLWRFYMATQRRDISSFAKEMNRPSSNYEAYDHSMVPLKLLQCLICAGNYLQLIPYFD